MRLSRSWLFGVLALFLFAITGTDGQFNETEMEEESEEEYIEERLLKVTTVIDPPYMQRTEDGTGFEGFIADVMADIAAQENLQYEYQLVADGKYGAEQANGNWSGMVGEVRRGVAHMAAAPVTKSRARQRVVSFTYDLLRLGIVVLMAKPEPNSDAERASSVIGEAGDLAEQSYVSYGVLRDSYAEAFFNASEHPQYKRMWEYMLANPGSSVNTISEGVQKVRDSQGRYAFITESVTANYYTKQEPCDLKTVGQIIAPAAYGFVVRTGDRLVEVLNRGILKIKRSNMMKVYEDKWWKDECYYRSTSGATASINVLTGPKSLVLFGILCLLSGL